MKTILSVTLSMFLIPAHPVFAQRPYTEGLIAKEIQKLGGESEGPNGLVFVAFRGESFKDAHFEMLRHCEKLNWFVCRETQGTKRSMSNLVELTDLKLIDIEASNDVVEGLRLLPNNTQLEEVRLANLRVSHEVLLALLRFPNLKLLDVESIEVPKDSIDLLLKLANKTEFVYYEIIGIDDREKELLDIEVDEYDKRMKAKSKEKGLSGESRKKP